MIRLRTAYNSVFTVIVVIFLTGSVYFPWNKAYAGLDWITEMGKVRYLEDTIGCGNEPLYLERVYPQFTDVMKRLSDMYINKSGLDHVLVGVARMKVSPGVYMWFIYLLNCNY